MVEKKPRKKIDQRIVIRHDIVLDVDKAIKQSRKHLVDIITTVSATAGLIWVSFGEELKEKIGQTVIEFVDDVKQTVVPDTPIKAILKGSTGLLGQFIF